MILGQLRMGERQMISAPLSKVKLNSFGATLWNCL